MSVEAGTGAAATPASAGEPPVPGASMRAWVMHGFDDLRLERRPVPEPPPGWALLRVRVVQLSVVEAMVARGIETYHFSHVRDRLAADGPSQLFGHEFCGEVVAINGDGHGLQVGDRAAGKAQAPCGSCALCRGGRADACQKGPILGVDYPGALAEYCIAPCAALQPVPPEVDDHAGATVQPSADAVAGVWAAGVHEGHVVAVLGFGCTGLVCAEASRARGAARVVVSDVRDEALDLARRLGYEAIDARERDVAGELAGTADVAFDCASGPPEEGFSGDATHLAAAACLRDEGVMVGISLLGEATCLPYDVFRHRALRFVFPVLCDGALVRETIALMAGGGLRVRESITHILQGLESVPEAIDVTAHKAQHGATNPAQIVVAADAART